MSQFLAFTKKELRESTATFRLYILLAVFALFGVMGPLLALLTPFLIEMIATAESGITIILPDPTAVDAWGQFFSNFAQMGTLVIIILFSGIMAHEFSRGTLVNLLTKGLKRRTVILSKFFSAGVIWTAAILLAIGVCYLYTAFYFDVDTVTHHAFMLVAPWLFGLFIIALLIFGGTLFGNFGGSLGLGLGMFFALSLANMIPGFARYNPVSLADGALAVLSGTRDASDLLLTIVVCIGVIAALIVGSVLVFNRKRV